MNLNENTNEPMNIKFTKWQRVIMLLLIPPLIFSLVMIFKVFGLYDDLKHYSKTEIYDEGAQKYYPAHYNEETGFIRYVVDYRLTSGVPDYYDSWDSFNVEIERTPLEAQKIMDEFEPIEMRCIYIYDPSVISKPFRLAQCEFISPELDPFEYKQEMRNSILTEIVLYVVGFFAIMALNIIIRKSFIKMNVKKAVEDSDNPFTTNTTVENELEKINKSHKKDMFVARYLMYNLIVPIIIVAPPIFIDDFLFNGRMDNPTIKSIGLLTVIFSLFFGVVRMKKFPDVIKHINESGDPQFQGLGMKFKLLITSMIPIFLGILGFLVYL